MHVICRGHRVFSATSAIILSILNLKVLQQCSYTYALFVELVKVGATMNNIINDLIQFIKIFRHHWNERCHHKRNEIRLQRNQMV